MFKNMIVKDVLFNEVDLIAGGAFLETFALNNQSSMGIKEVNGKFYMIKGGKSREIDVTTISELVKPSIIGKTIGEIESNSKLILLVQELNLIGKIVLEQKEDEVISLFD